MALNGNTGYLYGISFATASTSSGALATDSWYKITAKSTSSGFPAGTEVEDVFYNSTGLGVSQVAGDNSQKATLTKLAFVTDISDSESKEKFEETVQTDEVKSYQVGSKPEVTGTVNGYFLNDDTFQQTLLKKFRIVMIETTTGGLTRTEPDSTVFHTLLSLDESNDSDDTYRIYSYKPMIIDSLTIDKPMEGPIPFTINYTEAGSEKPNTFLALRSTT